METLVGSEAFRCMSPEVMEQTIGLNRYIPNVPWPKQMTFLELECMDALFGGSASGGKSEALLMVALQFADVPGHAALIVRRHFADLKLPGGLIDRSLSWLSKKAHWNAQEHRWRFKSGATLQFGYADKEGDERRYDGSEFQTICLDEACHFTERQIVYFYERLRRKGDIPVPLRMRLGTTPGGPGHEFIRKRYVRPGTPGKAFVPANVDDNPAVDAAQYRASLEEIKASNPLRYRQMLLGDWEAVEGGRFRMEWLRKTWRYDEFDRNWCVLSDDGGERFNWRSAATFQTYDPSASASAKADHFVISTWKVTPKANLVWWDCYRDKMEIPEQVQVAQSLYRQHRPQFIAVEEVLNQRAHAQLLRRSTNPVMVVRGVNPRSRDKLDRALGAISMAASGRLYLPESHPTFPLDDVRGELVRFTGLTDDEDSDIVDSFAYCCEILPTVRVHGGSGGSGAPFLWASRKGQYDGLR